MARRNSMDIMSGIEGVGILLIIILVTIDLGILLTSKIVNFAYTPVFIESFLAAF